MPSDGPALEADYQQLFYTGVSPLALLSAVPTHPLMARLSPTVPINVAESHFRLRVRRTVNKHPHARTHVHVVTWFDTRAAVSPSPQETLEVKRLKTHINSNVARGLIALKINEVIKEAHKHTCAW